jgi:hypothetical protein
MTNYVKSTNFASKDSLASGNPLKIVKGTEIDTELNNIATAVATKADLNSPVFIGTPTAPTASAGTSTSQISTTAFVITALQAVYPVGSVYTNAGVATNPNTLLGFGTWTAFGAGRVLIGNGGGFAAGNVGGNADSFVVSHNHTMSSAGSHNHLILYNGDTNNLNQYVPNVTAGTTLAARGAAGFETYVLNSQTAPADGGSTNSAGSHSHTINSEGVSGTNANLQPYIVVYMWQRTA